MSIPQSKVSDGFYSQTQQNVYKNILRSECNWNASNSQWCWCQVGPIRVIHLLEDTNRREGETQREVRGEIEGKVMNWKMSIIKTHVWCTMAQLA